ncbi:hypothetical protein PLESTF_000290600 [Pleodorina starrii]|nr:hypothetical protein PLESTM_001195300 [Pleodorina starrii]GLC65412.1 hypothetical protein PLESTF_000290600 [Pleodorina starrii]
MFTESYVRQNTHVNLRHVHMSESQAAQEFVLVAHRGNSANAPENTIVAFDFAVDSGFPHFETDCQLTADGAVVVLHDEHLGRTTPGAQGAVAEAAWADLRDLDAGSWFAPAFADARIPLLKDLLQRYRGRAHIHLELKSKQPELPGRVAQELLAAGWVTGSAGEQHRATAVAPAPALAAAAAPAAVHAPAAAPGLQGDSTHQNQNQNQDQNIPDGHSLHHHPHPDFAVPGLTITSFHLEQLHRSLTLLPGVTHGWLVHELTDDIIREALAAGCRQVCPRANVLSAAAVQLPAAAGLSVRAWGVKDMALLRHVVGCGCQGATVNWPREAREELLRVQPPLRQAPQAGHGQQGAPESA